MRKPFATAAILAALILAAWPVSPAASQSTSPNLALTQVVIGDLPGWAADTTAALVPGLKLQCRRLAMVAADTALGGQGLSARFGGLAGHWHAPCLAAADLQPNDDAAARAYFTHYFQPYRVGTPALVTGYFEPEVPGSLRRGGVFQTPLLARPSDLMQSPPPASDPLGPPVIGRRDGTTIVPYWSRAEIESGAIGDHARTLFWLKNPADLFFLQVQGSGRIRLPDGSVLRVGYDGRNGRPYTPIGRVLVSQNALAPADVSLQTIRAWLDAHPDRARQVMDANEDYVFFQVRMDADSDLGPPGALGVGLSAGRSAAVDRHFVPLGLPIYLDTTDPLTHAPLRRLVLAQDIGTDIVGPARSDLFMGSGDAASRSAGIMRQPGTEYLLLPRP